MIGVEDARIMAAQANRARCIEKYGTAIKAIETAATKGEYEVVVPLSRPTDYDEMADLFRGVGFSVEPHSDDPDGWTTHVKVLW